MPNHKANKFAETYFKYGRSDTKNAAKTKCWPELNNYRIAKFTKCDARRHKVNVALAPCGV